MQWQVSVFQKGGTKVVVHQRGLQTPEDGTGGIASSPLKEGERQVGGV